MKSPEAHSYMASRQRDRFATNTVCQVAPIASSIRSSK